MSDLVDFLRDNFEQFDAAAALEVALISLVIFWILLLLRGTTAMAVVRGAVILLIIAFVLVTILLLVLLNTKRWTGLVRGARGAKRELEDEIKRPED